MIAAARATLMSCLMAAALSGCVHAYPRRWAHLSAGNDTCADLVGRYSPIGEYDDPKETQRFGSMDLILTLAANPRDFDRRRLEHIEWVQITFGANGVLRVRAFRNDVAILELHYAEADATLSCERDGAKILAYSGASEPGASPDNPIAGLFSGATYLRKADDGSLIIKRHEAVVGLVFMMLPIAWSETGWMRFPAKD